MSKKNKTTQELEKAPKAQTPRPEVKRPYTVTDCMKLARIGNILFVVFIIISLIYYSVNPQNRVAHIAFETIAYGTETFGFVFFSLAVIWLDRLVRARGVMKVLLLVYIVTEVVLMLLEFKFIFPNAYNGLSLPLTICHSIFSAGVAFSMLSLDTASRKMEAFIIVTCTIMLAGMFLGLAGYRVYASILINAFAYIFFTTAVLYELRLEEISIDCYGDQAKVAKFSSTMFTDTPLMVEKPEKKKETLKQKAEKIRDTFTSEEHTILTDKDEKFEYEFGVDDDEDDDEDETDA